MVKHQITGLGPLKDDGSMFIFTRQPAPFIATKEWLAGQSQPPVVGDFLEYADDGVVTLVTEVQEETKEHQADAPANQKKSDGGEDSSSGAESSLCSGCIEDIAFVCHEANRAYCHTLGDDTQKTWAEAPKWQQESALKGVEYNIANPDAPPSGSHDSWLEQKRADGWKYGETKDAEKKEHPCFLPYEQLPIEQRRKDSLFKAVVAALTATE